MNHKERPAGRILETNGKYARSEKVRGSGSERERVALPRGSSEKDAKICLYCGHLSDDNPKITHCPKCTTPF